MGIKDRLRGSRVDERRLQDHEARAGEFVDAIERQFLQTPHDDFWEQGEPGEPRSIRHTWRPVTDSEPWRRLFAQGPAVLVSAAVVAAAHAQYLNVHSKLLSDLVRKRLPYEPSDIELMVELARRKKHGPEVFEPEWKIVMALKPVVAAAEAFAAQRDVREIEPALRRALEAVESNRDAPAADKTKLRARLRSLLAETGSEDAVGTALVVRQDDWGRRVVRRAQAFDGIDPLLTHLAQATSSRPTKAWQRTCAELLEDGDGLKLVRAVLEEAVVAEGRVVPLFEYEGRTYTQTIVLSDPNVVLLRGAVWAVPVARPEWGTDLIGRVLERWPADKVGNACLYALGEIGGDDAVRRLLRVRAKVKDRGILKQAEKAITAAAEREGLTPGQLAERMVPTHGLDSDATRTIRIGDAEAIHVLVPPGRIETRWRTPNGKTKKTAPAAVKETHAAELRALSTERSELRKTVAVERNRLEDLLAEERSWPFAEWRGLYRDHPVTGRLAVNLLWTVDGEPVLGADADDGDDATVALWHPIHADANDVARWRRILLEREIVQPFKQAHREIYLLAPAERETETYSNRFAGHVLRYPQTYALLKERGWSGNALGPWDGGYEADVRRDFPAAGLAATFYLEMAEENVEGPLADLCMTDQVRFLPLGERNPPPVRLEDVPAVVFSEAMRDVDLFVSVSSIAADPTWADRGEDRFGEYWRRTAFGELGTSAVQRRELLVDLIPRLSIADRCNIEDRYLRVRGDLRTYRIHLGSANVLMEPNDQFLCIVPARGSESRSRRVFLPFEGDPRLNVILSKAFLLVRDTQIKDETIRRQIRHGA